MQQELQQFTAIYEAIVNYLVNYSFQILGAIAIFVIGLLVARKVADWVLGICIKHKLDQTLSNFIASAIRLTLITMVGIMALSKMGISITPLLATVGAVSLGAGLAVQGLVSNYGSGLSIIVTRPFVVGDTIEVHNFRGLVKEVHLGYTILVDEDDTEIMIPNRHIVGEVIKNSLKDTLVESSIAIAYHHSPEEAIERLNTALEHCSALSEGRAIRVGIDNFGDSGINIGVRVWVPTQTYNAARYAINGLLFKTLNDAGIEVPFPRTDVHLFKPMP